MLIETQFIVLLHFTLKPWAITNKGLSACNNQLCYAFFNADMPFASMAEQGKLNLWSLQKHTAMISLKPACILLLVVTVTFFTCPDLLPLQNQLYLCLQSKNHIAVITHQSEQSCALIKLSRKQKASKLTQDHFSVAQVIIVRVFFHFSLHSFVFQCL